MILFYCVALLKSWRRRKALVVVGKEVVTRKHCDSGESFLFWKAVDWNGRESLAYYYNWR